MIPKFDIKELEIIRRTVPTINMSSINIYNYPVTPKEAVIAMMNRKPIWQIVGVERKVFSPWLLPDNVARAFVVEEKSFDPLIDGGGKDMFGIEWEYIPQVGGSMVRPGKPLLEDANEWREKVVWPDIDSWDWEGTAKLNNDTFLESDDYINCWFQNGFYERLITFMDFEGAAMAMIDEDQQGAVIELFDKLADLYIRIFDRFISYFPKIDGFYFHDDWGSQRETFFSPSLCAEIIVPAMKKVTDFLHSRRKYCDLHSCGQLLKQIPNMIAAGWDSWSGQAMNDTHKIYELYGDKILVGVVPELPDSETSPEDEQRAAAGAYADKFCNPKKPSYLNAYATREMITDAYYEELYKCSRENYSR